MRQKDQTNPLLPEWLTEQAGSTNQLSQSETDLHELIDDRGKLAETGLLTNTEHYVRADP